MTPARDVVGLGLVIPLLVAAAVVLFQFSTDRWGSGVRPPISIRRRSSRWATIGWGSTALYALYRFVSLVTGNAELPMGGCVIVEAVVLPMLMALADGVIVAWVLVELRNAGLGDLERDSVRRRRRDPADPGGGPGLRPGLSGALRRHGRLAVAGQPPGELHHGDLGGDRT